MIYTPLVAAVVALHSLFFPTTLSLAASPEITQTSEITITEGITATIERRLSDAVDADNLTIYEIGERPDAEAVLADVIAGDADTVLVVKDIFTTLNGSWATGSGPHHAPPWAAPDYRVASFDDSDKPRVIFAAVLDAEGNFLREEPVIFWSDGFARLGEANYGGFYETPTKSGSGWANNPLAASSVYNPGSRLAGPWCLTLGSGAASAAEVVCGVGLPSDLNVSTFVVWQEVAVQRGPGDPDDGDPGDPDDDSAAEIPTIQRRASDWIAQLNMTVHAIAERPDGATDDPIDDTSDNASGTIPGDLQPGDVVYLIKDVWTTRDGSWEASSLRGGTPSWAREAYLRPVGAPDYFDDAGGDHHLFAAVVGLDGEYVRGQEILYWSDGFELLGDEAYDSYTSRETKDGSGWINIPIGPGSNFVPERDEAGPWCWTLGEGAVGVAEVFCGGGLPAKEHVSTFVVWQAVEVVAGDDAPDFVVTDSVYLPLVSAR